MAILIASFSVHVQLIKTIIGEEFVETEKRLRWDNLPFGVPKKIVIGRESVKDSMIEMTETKLIAYNLG